MIKYTLVTDRLFLVTLKDLYPYETNVLVYHGFELNLVIDTFLGPSKMENMLNNLPKPSSNSPYIIVNTHHHFDHVWGNSAFPNSMRISTSLCYTFMKQNFENEKAENLHYWESDNKLCLPNCLINDTLLFPGELIEIFPSPGHTADSCSVFFHREKILAAGDNLEKPLPYLENNQWDPYLDTLDRYQSLQPSMICPGHGSVDLGDIEITRQYIHDWQNHDLERYEQDPFREIHNANVMKILKERFF